MENSVGIEAINTYVGQASLNIRSLFEARGLDLERFDNLKMDEKSVSLPCEDPVSLVSMRLNLLLINLVKKKKIASSWLLLQQSLD